MDPFAYATDIEDDIWIRFGWLPFSFTRRIGNQLTSPNFEAPRLRVTDPGAVQVLKREKAFHSHSSTEESSAKDSTPEPTTLDHRVYLARSLTIWAKSGKIHSDAFWRFSPSTPLNAIDVSRHLLLQRSVFGNQSFMKLNYDLWLLTGMSPVFLYDTRTPKRLGQEECGRKRCADLDYVFE